jgi:hypothetical protein
MISTRLFTGAPWTNWAAPVNAGLDEARPRGYYLAPWMEPPTCAGARR